MTERTVYLNGSFVPESEAKVSVFDSGFRSGDGVYDATRTFGHKLFKLREHVERLYRSLTYTRIDCGLSLDEMERLSIEVVERNLAILGDDDEYTLWQVISRGVPVAAGYANGSNATVSIFCVPVDFTRFARNYLEGVELVTPSTRRIPPQCLEAKAKITNKMNHMVAAFEARSVNPRAVPLMLDIDGNVAETLITNFFFVSGGRVCTPTNKNVLGGITRSNVLSLTSKMGIELVEGDFTPYDVYNADEAFLTGTSGSIEPVRDLNGVAIGDAIPGPITERLMREWNELVGIDVVAQALRHLADDDREQLLSRWENSEAA
jgi:branched-chain amino acid aminotransferase